MAQLPGNDVILREDKLEDDFTDMGEETEEEEAGQSCMACCQKGKNKGK